MERGRGRALRRRPCSGPRGERRGPGGADRARGDLPRAARRLPDPRELSARAPLGQRLVYLENQYLWSPEIVAVLRGKLRRPPTTRSGWSSCCRPSRTAAREDTRGQLGVWPRPTPAPGRFLACTFASPAGERKTGLRPREGRRRRRPMARDRLREPERALAVQRHRGRPRHVGPGDRGQDARCASGPSTSSATRASSGRSAELVDEVWRPVATEGLARRRSRRAITHRLVGSGRLAPRRAGSAGPCTGCSSTDRASRRPARARVRGLGLASAPVCNTSLVGPGCRHGLQREGLGLRKKVSIHVPADLSSASLARQSRIGGGMANITDERTSQSDVEQVKERVQDVAEQAKGRRASSSVRRSTRAPRRPASRSARRRGRSARTSEQLRQEGNDRAAIGRRGGRGPQRAARRLPERTDGDALLRDVEDFARRQPWLVVGAGALAGFMAARFVKASSGDRYVRRRSRSRRAADAVDVRRPCRRQVVRVVSADATDTGDLRDQPIGELLKQLASETATLVRQELELAKAEMREKGRKAGPGPRDDRRAGLVALLALGLADGVPDPRARRRDAELAGRPDRDRRLGPRRAACCTCLARTESRTPVRPRRDKPSKR